MNHLVNLAVGQTLAKVGEDVTELGSRDVTVAVLVKDLESLLDLLLRVSVDHLAGHHRQELGKVDCAVAVSIHFVDHVLKVSLGRVLAEGAHDCAELLGGDGAIAILIEQGEGLCGTAKTNKKIPGTDKGGGNGAGGVGREGAGGVDEERGVRTRQTTGERESDGGVKGARDTGIKISAAGQGRPGQDKKGRARQEQCKAEQGKRRREGKKRGLLATATKKSVFLFKKRHRRGDKDTVGVNGPSLILTVSSVSLTDRE